MGYHNAYGGYYEYIRECSVHRGIPEYIGDFTSTLGDIMSTLGDIMRTSGDVQYIGVFQ